VNSNAVKVSLTCSDTLVGVPPEAAVVAVRVNIFELGPGFESQIDELIKASPDLVAAQWQDPQSEVWRLVGTEAGHVLMETLDHVNQAVFGQEAGRMVTQIEVLLHEVDCYDNLEATKEEEKAATRHDPSSRPQEVILAQVVLPREY
jgi:hypothetical protein